MFAVRCGAPVLIFLLGLAGAGAQEALSPKLQAFRDIYKELVEINTTDSVGDTVRAAEAMAARTVSPTESVVLISTSSL